MPIFLNVRSGIPTLQHFLRKFWIHIKCLELQIRGQTWLKCVSRNSATCGFLFSKLVLCYQDGFGNQSHMTSHLLWDNLWLSCKLVLFHWSQLPRLHLTLGRIHLWNKAYHSSRPYLFLCFISSGNHGLLCSCWKQSPSTTFLLCSTYRLLIHHRQQVFLFCLVVVPPSVEFSCNRCVSSAYEVIAPVHCRQVPPSLAQLYLCLSLSTSMAYRSATSG